MSYAIIILDEKIFAKDIAKINKPECTNVMNKISQLQKDGILNAQVKRLKNYPLADFRLRVGNYRVLFNFSLENKEILVLRVLHRSELY